jgi:hypothetical protein
MYIIIPLARKNLIQIVGKMCEGCLNGMTKKEERKHGKLGNGEELGDGKLDSSEKERGKSGKKNL